MLATAIAGEAAGQTPLVDYESSARAAQVRDNAAWRLAFRPAVSVFQQSVTQLRNAPGVSAAAKAEADALLKTAAGESEPDARRTLWRAVAVLTGQPWSPSQELFGALALKPSSPIWTGKADQLLIAPLYPAPPSAAATYTVDLYATEPTTSATPKRGALLRRVAAGSVRGGGQARLPVKLNTVPDGSYLLVARLSAAEGSSTELAQSVYVVRNFDRRYATLKAGLAKLSGHDEAKGIIEYPYALGDALRSGRREVISYDFASAMERSARLLAALKAGKDEVRQATGLQNRAYRFPETGELVPFQLFVSSAWRPGQHLPLVVALHGANLDETNMLVRDGGRMQKLAEEHGFIVVAPLGYRLNSAYGSQRGLGSVIGEDQVERRRRSEQDVLLVTRLVQKEYDVDAHRLYLTGNSMGGGGTWWIGGRYADMWAALAPAAFGGVLPEDVPNLIKTPILAVVGDRDELGMLDRVKAAVATLRAGGADPQYLEIEGGTHASAIETAMPAIFDFFEKHSK